MMLVAALHTIMFMFNSFPSTEDDATFPSTEDAVPLIHPKRAKTKTGSKPYRTTTPNDVSAVPRGVASHRQVKKQP